MAPVPAPLPIIVAPPTMIFGSLSGDFHGNQPQSRPQRRNVHIVIKRTGFPKQRKLQVFRYFWEPSQLFVRHVFVFVLHKKFNTAVQETSETNRHKRSKGSRNTYICRIISLRLSKYSSLCQFPFIAAAVIFPFQLNFHLQRKNDLFAAQITTAGTVKGRCVSKIEQWSDGNVSVLEQLVSVSVSKLRRDTVAQQSRCRGLDGPGTCTSTNRSHSLFVLVNSVFWIDFKISVSSFF